jgi:hypothetical protein
MGKKIVAGVIIAIIALVVCLVPLKEAAYSVTVDYQDTETYYETEPYEDTETCVVTEPLKYQRIGIAGTREVGDKWGPHYELINRDSVAGYFDVRVTLYGLSWDTWHDLQYKYGYTGFTHDKVKKHKEYFYTFEGRIYAEPGEKGEIFFPMCDAKNIPHQYYYNSDYIVLDYWEVSPQEVTKTKVVKVTKYRQVEKQRTVTTQRPETRYRKVTLLDYLLHY